jgi:integrase/recombinase XerC/integrase/recombinase XerD
MSQDLIIANGATSAVVADQERIAQMLEEFLGSQDVKESSRRLYRRTLRPYFRFLTERETPLAKVTRNDILAYKDHLLAAGMSPLTVGSYLTAVRKFYTWAEALQYYPNVAKAVKTPTRKQQYRKQALTAEQSKRLLQHFREQSLRDYAIVNLMLCTGLRCIEVSRALVEDVTLKSVEGGEAARVLLVQGKGRLEKDAFVILNEAVYRPIREYLSTRRAAKAKEPLFSSISNCNRAGNLSPRTISQIVKDGLRAIGLDDRAFTAHSLRHSTASLLIKNGATPEEVKDVLRHASTAITQVYYASVAEEVRLNRNTEATLAALLH